MLPLKASFNVEQLIDLSQVSEGDNIGYLGCGTGGHLLTALSTKVGPTGDVYAVDILPEALTAINSIAKSQNLTNVKTVWSDLEAVGATKITAHTLDYVFLVNMLYQNKDRASVLKEADRLLKISGTMVIVEWLPGINNFGPADEIRISPETLESMVTQLGYSFVDGNSISDYHYYRIFRK